MMTKTEIKKELARCTVWEDPKAVAKAVLAFINLLDCRGQLDEQPWPPKVAVPSEAGQRQ